MNVIIRHEAISCSTGRICTVRDCFVPRNDIALYCHFTFRISRNFTTQDDKPLHHFPLQRRPVFKTYNDMMGLSWVGIANLHTSRLLI
ncbi:hypothetical protein FHS10_002457 [Mucilaginibacter dorajii]|nr:hypothetical protein [Mucilaginibacter dorajii]